MEWDNQPCLDLAFVAHEAVHRSQTTGKNLVMVLQNHSALSFRISDFDFPKRLWSECCKSMQEFSQHVHVQVSFCFCKSHQALVCRTGLCFPGRTIPGSLCLPVEIVVVFLLPVVLLLGLLSLAQEVRGHEHPAASRGSAGPWSGK